MSSIYTPFPTPMPKLCDMEAKYDDLVFEYEQQLAVMETEFTDAKKQAFVTNPATICFQYDDRTREECLLDQWNETVARVTASSERKKKRIENARIKWLVERGFQAQHCFIQTKTSEGILYGYYKVTRFPTHYSFVLKRAIVDHDRVNIGKETILPITLDMSGEQWCNVTPEKIHTP